MSTILEDNNVREKRRHICPERGFWTILSVKKWIYFLGSSFAPSRDKEMAHSVQSTAVDVFPLPPPFLTNSTVVPLLASSRSQVLSGGCVCVGRIGGSERGKT